MLENLLHTTGISRPTDIDAELEKIARQRKLIQRKSNKFSASGFLRTLLGAVQTGKASLNDMAMKLAKLEDKPLTRQALWERFNRNSVSFMISCVSRMLSLRVVEAQASIGCFGRIIIEDSSQEKTSPKNHEDFPGHGNDKGKTAGAKFDFAFDLLSGEVVHEALAGMTEADQNLGREVVAILRKNDLLLRDMGFFVLSEFVAVEKIGAWWLSRLPLGTAAWDMEGRDIESILSNTCKRTLRIKCRLGAEGVEAWLIATRATPEQTAEKRRKRRENARKNGRSNPRGASVRDEWHIVVTNIEPSMMSARDILKLYGIRWRIEIIFRAWKGSTYFREALARKSNPFHLQTLMYAGLLWLVLTMKITTILCASHPRRLLSIEKIAKGLADYLPTIKNFSEIFDYSPDLRHVSMDKRKRKSLYQKAVCCLT